MRACFRVHVRARRTYAQRLYVMCMLMTTTTSSCRPRSTTLALLPLFSGFDVLDACWNIIIRREIREH